MNGVLYMTLHLSKHDGMLSNKHGRAKTQGLISGLRIVLKLPTLDDTTYAITWKSKYRIATLWITVSALVSDQTLFKVIFIYQYIL